MKKLYGIHGGNWSNEKRLDTLEVQADNIHAKETSGVLIFSNGPSDEMAQVYLDNGDISKVVFSGFGGRRNRATIEKKDALKIIVGEGNCKRDVYHFLKPGGPAPVMRLGITHHSGLGTWSSLPHGFEKEENLEPGFEEVFFYILRGGSERAIQVGKGLWNDGTNVDAVWPVYNRTFGTVPMGYHPVAGEPGVHVSYVWCYLAKHKRWEKVK